MRRALTPLLAVFAASASPMAAELPALGARGGASGLFSELRFGLGAHDPWGPERGSLDARAQILFARPFGTGEAYQALVPRVHLGGALNTAGKTSHGYAGLTWSLDLGAKLFVEASLGGALHNGRLGQAFPAGNAALGCPAQFREAAAIGYRIDEKWNLVASVEHLSNSGLCRRNRGLTNLGLELGYRF